MEKSTKLTKKDYFAQLREIVKDNEELVKFIDHEVHMLNKKNSKNSQTKGQKVNEEISKMLVDELAKLNKGVTITDLLATSEVLRNFTYEENKEVKHLTNQKVSSLLNKMTEGENAQVVKVTDKKKSYFSIAD